MTIPYTFTNGTLANATEVNTNFAYTLGNAAWNRIISTTNADTSDHIGYQAHTATKMTMIDSGADIWYSADSGVTWTEKNTDLDTADIIHRNCKADRTYAIFIEMSGDNEVVHTADSGVTCTTKTSCTFGTAIYAISYPTTSLIVVGGNDAAGTDFIVFSTDSGANWTNATTTVDAICPALDMYDGSNGFALTNTGKIFSTSNAAVDWTDTTHTYNPVPEQPNTILVAVSSTECVFAYINTAVIYIFKYDGSGNAVMKLRINTPVFQGLGNFVIDSNGIIYCAAVSTSANTNVLLLRSTDDGETWDGIIIPCYDAWTTNAGNIKSMLSLDEDDNLYVFASQYNIPFKIQAHGGL